MHAYGVNQAAGTLPMVLPSAGLTMSRRLPPLMGACHLPSMNSWRSAIPLPIVCTPVARAATLTLHTSLARLAGRIWACGRWTGACLAGRTSSGRPGRPELDLARAGGLSAS